MPFSLTSFFRGKSNIDNAKFDDAYIKIIEDQRIYRGELKESVRVILRECATTLSVCRVSMWLLSGDHKELSCLLLYDCNKDSFESGAVITAEAYPNYFDQLSRSRFIDASDAFNDSRTNELKLSYLKKLNIRSMLDATIRDLRHDGQLQGILCAEMVGVQRDWTADEKVFVTSIADLLSQRLVAYQLEQSEVKYKALYESAAEGIIIFGDTKFVDVNPAACAMFRGNKGEIMGLSPIDLSPKYQPDGQLSAPKAMAFMTGCINGISQNFEWRYTRLDGTEFDAEITLSSVNLLGEDTLFALVRDITAKKRASKLESQNHQLKLARKEAEKSAKSKMNFLANMSHEIRTPMNGIFGVVSLVLDTPLNSEQKGYIETIESSTESLLTILNDVLEYSKLSMSNIELEQREFNLRHLVMDVVRTFQVLASNKGLRLDSLIYPDVPSVLVGDNHRIRQILSNLVGNAVKFTEVGSVHLKVSCVMIDDSEHNIRFSVVDTGIGMDDLTIEKLFQPFTQADASITRNYGGTGLGLAICHDLAQALGGRITVESKIDQGTTFIFDVCLQKVEQSSKKGEPSSEKSKLVIADLVKGQTFPNKPILIVDDNEINRKVTSSIVEKLGYPVTIARNGQEAVGLCKENNYSIILMDLSMPEMDGFEATEKIRGLEKESSRATIIAVTGHAFLEYRQRCEEVGIDDFLTKPYNLFKLKEKLDYYSKDLLD